MNKINIIYNGDCLEVMKEIDDKSIDMILCDLPYQITACEWDIIIPFDKLWKEYNRIIKDNSAIVLTGSQPFTSMLIMSNLKMFKHSWIWEKQKGANFLLAKYQPIKYHEDILIFGGSEKKVNFNPQKYKVLEFNEIKDMDKKRLKSVFDNKEYDRYAKIDRRKNVKDVINPKDSHYGKMNVKIRNTDDGTRFPKSILKINKKINSNLHPTQKPIALGQYLIKTYTDKNDLVLDNTCGSGSFLVSAVLEKRNFIGIEKDEKYYEIAKQRVKQAQIDIRSKLI